MSPLLIPPQEQARFLRTLVRNTLPVRPEALRNEREIVECHDVEGWIIYSKTSTA